MRRRWRLLVKDANGSVVYERTYLLRSSAVRDGSYLTTPPLSFFEVVRG